MGGPGSGRKKGSKNNISGMKTGETRSWKTKKGNIKIVTMGGGKMNSKEKKQIKAWKNVENVFGKSIKASKK